MTYLCAACKDSGQVVAPEGKKYSNIRWCSCPIGDARAEAYGNGIAADGFARMVHSKAECIRTTIAVIEAEWDSREGVWVLDNASPEDLLLWLKNKAKEIERGA